MHTVEIHWWAVLPVGVTIIIKVFVKHKVLSVEIILSSYTHARMHVHTHTHTHTCRHPNTGVYWLYKTEFTYNLKCKQTTNRAFRQRKIAVQNRKYGGSVVLGRELSWGLIWRSPESMPVLPEFEQDVLRCLSVRWETLCHCTLPISSWPHVSV